MASKALTVGITLLLYGLAPSAAFGTVISAGIWDEFSFTTEGVKARGCSPAFPGGPGDPSPDALDCVASSANNSEFAPAPPWTFAVPAGTTATLIVTDAFLHGDSFDIFDAGVFIGSTPAVANDGNGCGDNPAVCLADPAASHDSFLLGDGIHSITIIPDVIADAGAGYFQLVPEPSAFGVLCFGLMVLGVIRRRFRSAWLFRARRMTVKIFVPILVALCLLPASLVFAQIQAPDASGEGPHVPAFGFYKLPETIDEEVLPGCTRIKGFDCKVQLSARLYYPIALSGPLPLVIFLHGNHATCGHFYNPPPGGTDPPELPGTPRIDVNVLTGFFDDTFAGTGECSNPANPIFVPSYTGYDYLAKRLVSWGYVVVSIDANRGINGERLGRLGVKDDVNLIKARGRLVLRHLAQLSTWNTNGGTPVNTVGTDLEGLLDFANVGLMGHSRGGEGVRAANALFTAPAPNIWPGLIPGLTIKAIFEIAPTDMRRFDPDGVIWNVLLPMCDGDLFDLQGVRPFDREILKSAPLSPFEGVSLQTSTYTVWGANHNFFNTEWQQSDGTLYVAPGALPGAPPVLRDPPYPSYCEGEGNTPLYDPSPGSQAQQLVALSSLLAFFRGNVGAKADVAFNQNFNPPFGLPQITIVEGIQDEYPTRTDRGYVPPGGFKVFDDFTGEAPDPATGSPGKSTYGFPYNTSNVVFTYGMVPSHDPLLTAGVIGWPTDPTVPGANTYFQTNWTDANKPGRDVRGYKTLDLRVSRQPGNPEPTTDFSIRLVGANGVMTRPVKLSTYTDPNFAQIPGNRSDLSGPVGIEVPGITVPHPILQTVRIPLAAFGNFAFIAPQVHGVRFVFDQTTAGAIYVANIRLSKEIGGGAANFPPVTTPSAAEAVTPTFSSAASNVPLIAHPATIVSPLTFVGVAPELNDTPGYRIGVQADGGGFPPRDSFPVMIINNTVIVSAGYDPVDPSQLVFTLTPSQRSQVSSGMPVIVQYGPGPAIEIWDCGSLP